MPPKAGLGNASGVGTLRAADYHLSTAYISGGPMILATWSRSLSRRSGSAHQWAAGKSGAQPLRPFLHGPVEPASYCRGPAC